MVEMKQIDTYSYQWGVIDCFNEMVKAGMKHIALAHPCTTKENRDSYIPFVNAITNKYQTHYYLDDDPLITDLFPYSLNRNTYNIIFYKEKKYIEEYIALKERKKQSILNHQYLGKKLECRFKKFLLIFLRYIFRKCHNPIHHINNIISLDVFDFTYSFL